MQEGIPLVQRTALEVLPLLKPLDDHAEVWPVFLRQIITYLMVDITASSQGKGTMVSIPINGHDEVVEVERDGQRIENTDLQNFQSLSQNSVNQDFEPERMSKRFSYPLTDLSSTPTGGKFMADPMFVENIVTVLQTCYLLAPFPARLDVLPDVICGLGRYILQPFCCSGYDV